MFSEKGYENTSVTDIMNAVGIAKGTLYHHFKSKEDIMDALIKRQTAVILSVAGKIADDKSIPVKERIVRTILALHVDHTQTEGKKMMEQLHKPKNIRMHQKNEKIVLQGVPPIMSDIVKDGVKQGIFETSYPLECMDKIQARIYHLERLL